MLYIFLVIRIKEQKSNKKVSVKMSLIIPFYLLKYDSDALYYWLILLHKFFILTSHYFSLRNDYNSVEQEKQIHVVQILKRIQFGSLVVSCKHDVFWVRVVT